MAESFKIAIVGSGPSGMSAGGRAAELGVSHVLLEKSDHLSDTIYKYQKGKHVMATPDILPLRSPMSFAAGTREAVLGAWNAETEKHKVNVRYKAEVTAIKGEKGKFELVINRKDTITAEHVVLCIGLQGNLRKFDIPGADWEYLQYQLDDPGEYEGETIVVVGAGDAGIENALALAKQNKVVMINRVSDFARAKEGNRNGIEAAIEKGVIDCYYDAMPSKIEPGVLTLDVPQGQAAVKCDRIIARLGAIAPRAFVESCGIKFPGKEVESLPELSPTYESNVPGLYVIGALGGYPLIKQAMNQGYEVVEFILGNKVKPADEPLLEQKFGALLEKYTVDQVINLFRERVPLISGLTALQLREFLIDSTIHMKSAGDVIFERDDYTTTLFMIVEGGVKVQIDPNNPSVTVPLGQGKFFGEIGMMAGRPRAATVVAGENCVLIESPARTMTKLFRSIPSVRDTLNKEAMARQIRTYISQGIPDDALSYVLETTENRSYKIGTVLFNEGDPTDGVHIVRKGSVTVSRTIGGRNVAMAYLPTGRYLGEMGVVANVPRNATVRAAVNTETIFIPKDRFLGLIERVPELRQKVEEEILARLIHTEKVTAQPEAGSILQFLIEQGMGEATDMLLIDESLCVRCNNCEVACAETHGGISRLNREAGPTVANVHVPTSCRHCEDPHCMKDCPPDAIHRTQDGEVFIQDTCIGCGNCKNNCPYGVIQMGVKQPEKPGLASWLLFGLGPGPGQAKSHKKDKHAASDAPKKAVKCDMCKDIDGGPACVRACPTGAAIRIGPEQFFTAVSAR